MKVALKNRKQIADGTVLLVFDLLSQEMQFKAGQFFKLTLLNPLYTDQKGNSRFLGISNSPTEQGIIETATRLRDSAFKKYLNEMEIGTEVEISDPDGHIGLPEDTTKPLVFITGGIGIVPMMSIFRFIKAKSLPYKLTLIFSNDDNDSAPFLEELMAYAEENPNFTLITTMTKDPEWSGEKRRIDTQFLKDYLQEPEKYLYCITGTPRLVPAMFRFLKEIGVPIQNIKMEIFTGY